MPSHITPAVIVTVRSARGASAKRWFAAREQQLLPVEYYHVVFTLPGEVAQLAFYNKAQMYQLLFKAASQTLLRTPQTIS